MREFIVENLVDGDAIGLAVIALNNLVALMVAFFIMATYRFTYSGTAYSRKFNVSLGAITIVTTMIMSVISNNVALSLGMVGALSIIRFRTAVKDVRDATFIFWSIAVGIGCGVSQYTMIGVGSVMLFVFLLLTKNVVSSGNQLMVIQGKADAQNRIVAAVEEHLEGREHLFVKNLSSDSCEFVYGIKGRVLTKANEAKMVDISQKLMKLEGVIRVSLTEQQDDISR